MIKEKYVVDLSMYKDVVFLSKNNVYIEHGAKIGTGTVIEPNVMISEKSVIGKNSMLYCGAIVIDSVVGDSCVIGQYALLRDKVILKNNVVIGPHSEISRSIFENNSGAFHKCVVIDAHIKENVRLGAGVVTANSKHDGEHKLTIIEKNAKIGVNVSLVAPIIVGENSWIGAGSTILKNVKPHTTVIARSEQTTLDRTKNAI